MVFCYPQQLKALLLAPLVCAPCQVMPARESWQHPYWDAVQCTVGCAQHSVAGQGGGNNSRGAFLIPPALPLTGFGKSLCTLNGFGALCLTDKPTAEEDEGPGSHTPYKMIQTIGLSVGAAVAYIIIVLGLMFYCKKRRKAKRLKKHPESEEPEMECLNGEASTSGRGNFTASPLPLGWRG